MKKVGLIILSFVTGCLGLLLGSIIGNEIFMILLGVSGFFIPTLYILDQMYIKFKNNNNEWTKKIYFSIQ